MNVTERTNSPKSRAQRFPLRLPVRYLVGDETRWHIGLTDVISTSETVIRGKQPVDAVGPIRFVICLPTNRAHRGGGCVIGYGRIKRTARRAAHREPPTFAVAVTKCRLARLERFGVNHTR